MGSAGFLDHADLLQFNGLRAIIRAQSDPFAEQYRHESKM
jgi:hypothetical protein